MFDNLQLKTQKEKLSIRRYLHRGDVIAALGEPVISSTGNATGRVAFEDEAEWSKGPLILALERGHEVLNWQLPVPSAMRTREAHQKLLMPFLRKCCAAVPVGFAFLRQGRPKHLRHALGRHFDLYLPGRMAHRFTSEILEGSNNAPIVNDPITIVLPVYNAFELLPEVLARVEKNTDLPWRLILVEDCSSDDRVRPWLKGWIEGRVERVTLILNDNNLGFVASANLALKRAEKHRGHVVLLNSDSFVPNKWASRLIAPIAADQNIASVTPMSNDATIFSVPLVGGACQLAPGAVDLIDNSAAELNPNLAQAVVPTGVGYCMAMSREALGRVPQFDTIFGKGYGEEVDWCRRVAQTGMTNIGIGNLFVEHHGAQSFGEAKKNAEIEAAGKIVSRRYPQYDSEVQEFIRLDPLWSARFVLSLAWAASRPEDPLPVYLAHSMGGGAESWLSHRIRERERESKPTAVIRVGGRDRFVVELHVPGGVTTVSVSDESELPLLFRRCVALHVVYSCGVGDIDPISLPRLLCELASDGGRTLEAVFHDYLPISPSFNLLDRDAKWRGVPDPVNNDVAHDTTRPDGRSVSLSQWRSAWTKLIQRADNITVFSNSSKKIVSECWPWAEPKIRVVPSRVSQIIHRMEPAIAAPGQKVSLAILGAIGEEKGAKIVSDLSFALEDRHDSPNLVIIGELDRRFPLSSSTVVTGRYNLQDLASLMRLHRVAAWLMPSICPETFSFTTHEMIATGLPVMAFDLGAQGDAVRVAENGYIVPQDIEQILETYRRIQALGANSS